MHMRGCPKSGRMKMTIETTSYPANPHKVLVRVISDALRRGRRKNGMSKRSIQNRIQQTYRCRLGSRFAKELTKSLKRMVRGGYLDKIGYRYKPTGRVPSRGGWRLTDALPVHCRCNQSRSRSCSRCPSSSRSCAPYSAAGSSRHPNCWSRMSRSRSRSRSRSSSRSRSRRSRSRSHRKLRAVGRRRRVKRRGRKPVKTRSRSRHGRSRSRSRISSRSQSRSRMLIIRGRSRSRGRSRTRRSRPAYSTRSQSVTRKRRRMHYSMNVRSRSTSRSTTGVRSPTPQLLLPEPKLDMRRGVFKPGVVPAMNNAASTSSHSTRRDSPYPYSPGPSSSSSMKMATRGRPQSPSRGGGIHHRSCSMPARSRSRSPSTIVPPPLSRSAVPYITSLKPLKPALRQSAPQSPNPMSPNTLTPKSMVKFLTQ
ncbi:hypothetical protein R1flu_012831 [Riccia fluitans]|uniref:H15 domain-containing protein n=1 Tax=Riccia fluitans TaxID=41844 RepID=A0ABD1ZE70_9MARC